MTSSIPSLVFGTAGIAAFDDDTVKGILSTLENNGVKYLDTAFIYVSFAPIIISVPTTDLVHQPNSEVTIGKYDAPKSFTIHTKAPGFKPGFLSKKSVIDGLDSSLKRLGVDTVCRDSRLNLGVNP